jgi:hypothetical protein
MFFKIKYHILNLLLQYINHYKKLKKTFQHEKLIQEYLKYKHFKHL